MCRTRLTAITTKGPSSSIASRVWAANTFLRMAATISSPTPPRDGVRKATTRIRLKWQVQPGRGARPPRWKRWHPADAAARAFSVHGALAGFAFAICGQTTEGTFSAKAAAKKYPASAAPSLRALTAYLRLTAQTNTGKSWSALTEEMVDVFIRYFAFTKPTAAAERSLCEYERTKRVNMRTFFERTHVLLRNIVMTNYARRRRATQHTGYILTPDSFAALCKRWSSARVAATLDLLAEIARQVSAQ